MKRFYSEKYDMYVEDKSTGYLNIYTKTDVVLTSVKFNGEITQEIAELACQLWMKGMAFGNECVSIT